MSSSPLPDLAVPPQRIRREEVPRWLALTRDPDARARRRAVAALCPCRVRADDREVWRRLLELTDDADASVRSQVFHALIDGSPRALESTVHAALESMRDDADPRLRRRVRGVLAQYRRTGRLNVG